MDPHQAKAQSAMEYLMTYGWSIVIIAIAIGLLFYLGVFGGSSSIATGSCLATPGYVCTNPILNSTGNISILLGQATGHSIVINSIACTNSSVSSPTNTLPLTIPITLPSGSKTALIFQCPSTGGAIGTPYKGYLWITYNSAIQSGLVAKIATFSAAVSTTSSLRGIQGGSSNQQQIGLCTVAGNNEANTLSANPGCGMYFCDGANYNYVMSSMSWSQDVVAYGPYASTGSQSSNTCSASSSGPVWQSFSEIGINGITTYSIINSPQYYNSGGSISSSYSLSSNSDVVIMVGCGWTRCGSVTFPSGCTTEMTQGYEGSGIATEIAYCQSQGAGTYTIGGSAGSHTAIEAALLGVSGASVPTLSLSFSAGTSIKEGVSDTATGTTSIPGDSISIEDCAGSSCTPSNVLSSGTTSVTYNTNTLGMGTYRFDACDTVKNTCSSLYTVYIENPTSMSFTYSGSYSAGEPDTITGSTTVTGDTVDIEDCSGVSCAPAAIISSGITTTTYNTNTLQPGTYGFKACDTTVNACTADSYLTLTTPMSISFSNGILINPGTNDIITGTNANSLGEAEVEYCLGSGCTPANIVASGTPSASYNANSLSTGNYIFDACDATQSICSTTAQLTVTSSSSNAICTNTIYTYYNGVVPNTATISYILYGGGGGATGYTSAGGKDGLEAIGSYTLNSGNTLTVYSGGGGGGGWGPAGGGGDSVILSGSTTVAIAAGGNGATDGLSGAYPGAGGNTGGTSYSTPSCTAAGGGGGGTGHEGGAGGTGVYSGGICTGGVGGAGWGQGGDGPTGGAGAGYSSGGGGGYGGGGGGGGDTSGGTGGTGGSSGASGTAGPIGAGGLGASSETSSQYGLGGAAGSYDGGNAGIAILQWPEVGGSCALSSV